MTQTEHFTAIKTTEQPRARDWLAVCGMFAIAIGCVAQSVGAYFNHLASMEYWKATDRMANRLENQMAISAKAYRVVIEHYEPKLDQAHLVNPNQSRLASESPFPE